MQTKLSIIIPVYNAERFLRRCLNSVLNQTYSNIEIICVNDGSTDDSSEILKSYEKTCKNIFVINQENQGMGASRNNGLRIANGRYVGFVDSDDYIEADMYKRLIENLENNESDISYCGVNVIYEAWENFKDNDSKNFKVKILDLETVTTDNINKVDAYVWHKVFKKKIIDDYTIRFPEGVWYEDAAFSWCYLCVSKKISSIESKLYNYVRYPASIMGKTFAGNKRNLDHIKICNYVLNFLKVNHLHNKFKKPFLQFSLMNMASSFRFSPKGERVRTIQANLTLIRELGLSNTFIMIYIFISKLINKIYKGTT